MAQKSYTILLADDDIEDQELLKEAIGAVEPLVEVKTFINGVEIINYLSNLEEYEMPILIVLDFNMPFLNGLEVLQKNSSDMRYEGIPKVIWSTANTPESVQECLTTGAVRYFMKPNNAKGLLKLL